MDAALSIITVNYNGFADTCALIDSIPFSDFPLEVIVVDNGSRRNEAQLIAERYPQVRVLRSERNLGFAGGNNLGIRIACGKYLYLVNNDTVFDSPSNIQSLVSRLESSPSIGVVCPKIRFHWEPRPIQFAGYTRLSSVTLRNRAIGYGETDRGQYNMAHESPYAHGAAMMLKREAVDAAGLMPECFFLYYEELDWSMMIRRAGYTIWYEPASTIFHKESQSTGQDSPLRTYYISRNRLLFAKRNVGGFNRFLCYIYIICVVALRDVIRHLLRRRIDLVGATCRGIVDFLKM